MRNGKKLHYSPYRLQAQVTARGRRAKVKAAGSPDRLTFLPYLQIVAGFGVSAVLICLNIAYKRGFIAVDYGGYISIALAAGILVILAIWYIKKLIRVFQLDTKLKNRH